MGIIIHLLILITILIGKTSLANAVQGKGCDPHVKEDTIGIDFYEWLPEENDVEILIVDCAGEHKYTLTHQLFVSIGTDILYNFVTLSHMSPSVNV